jgi:hypothetical protein
MGVRAVEHYLNNRPKPHIPTTHFLLQLVRFILQRNNFHFMGEHYEQRCGTAMGTRMAPSYANLTMGLFESEFMERQQYKPHLWKRFIDDIFMVWPHGLESLNIFIKELNEFSSLKFTHTISPNAATFLDVDINIDNGQLITSIHVKPTNHMQYLHYNSCHPSRTIRSIPYSLAVRGNRIPNTAQSKSKYIDSLKSAFSSRGYPKQLVDNQINRAINNPTTKNPNNNDPPVRPFITIYHPKLEKEIRQMLQYAQPILATPETSHLLPKAPPVAFRQPPNFKAILSHTDPTPKSKPPPSGSFPCNNINKRSNRGRKCDTCITQLPSKSFTGPVTNMTYPIRGHNTCISENVIYMLECTQQTTNPTTNLQERCQAFYVGLTTQQFRGRMNGHRQSVKHNEVEKPVAEHAASHQVSNFDKCYKTTILRKIQGPANYAILRQYELAYQYILKSRKAQGLPGLNIR